MQDPPLQPLDYAAPTPRAGRIFWIKPTFLWCFICWFWVAVSFFVMPRFEQIFKDFKVSLPLITQIGLVLCRLIANNYGWTILLVAPLFIPLFIPRSDRRPAAAWLFIALGYVALVLSLLLMLSTVFLPMLTLINAAAGK
jgi:hypothetical protein